MIFRYIAKRRRHSKNEFIIVFINRILMYKHKIWEYENEYRIIVDDKKYLLLKECDVLAVIKD